MSDVTTPRPRFTVGIDLGDKESKVCVLDEAGDVIAKMTVKTTPDGIRSCLGQAKRARVVFEAGAHSAWISRLANEFGHEVFVANPNRLPTISRNVSKTDEFDAEHLARLGRADPRLLAPITHRPEQAQVDRELIQARNALVEARTSFVNHVRGTAKSFGVRVGPCDTSVFADRAKRDLPAHLRRVLDPILDTIRDLTKKIRIYDRKIAKVAAERYPVTARLQQIPGVGPITSLCFVVTLDDPLRFKSSRSVGPFLGLRPRRCQTGDFDPELPITRAGDRLMRKLLVQAAHYVLGHFGPDTDLRRWGKKLEARGGKNAKKRAIVATARKLSVILHRLWVSGDDYRPLRDTTTKEAA